MSEPVASSDLCPQPCQQCKPYHHWLEDGIAPDEREDRGADHPVLVYDRQHGTEHAREFFTCKHCGAWWTALPDSHFLDVEEGDW